MWAYLAVSMIVGPYLSLQLFLPIKGENEMKTECSIYKTGRSFDIPRTISSLYTKTLLTIEGLMKGNRKMHFSETFVCF